MFKFRLVVEDKGYKVTSKGDGDLLKLIAKCLPKTNPES